MPSPARSIPGQRQPCGPGAQKAFLEQTRTHRHALRPAHKLSLAATRPPTSAPHRHGPPTGPPGRPRKVSQGQGPECRYARKSEREEMRQVRASACAEKTKLERGGPACHHPAPPRWSDLRARRWSGLPWCPRGWMAPIEDKAAARERAALLNLNLNRDLETSTSSIHSLTRRLWLCHPRPGDRNRRALGHQVP